MPKILLNCINIDDDIDIHKYLHYFSDPVQTSILSYHFYQDQKIHLASELLKYCYLPNELGIDIRSVKIDCTAYGKPFYTSSILDNTIFNISHSRNKVILAYTRDPDIKYLGVDIEYIDNSFNYLEVMPLVFSDFEQAQIKNVNDFYKFWTKKEALIKAYGSGFGSDFYQQTSLILDQEGYNKDCYIATRMIDNKYFLSICVVKFCDFD